MRLKSGAALENLFRSAGREVTDRAPFSARRRYGVLCKRRGSRKHMMPGSTLSRSNAKPVKRKKPDSNEKLLGSVHVRPLSLDPRANPIPRANHADAMQNFSFFMAPGGRGNFNGASPRHAPTTPAVPSAALLAMADSRECGDRPARRRTHRRHRRSCP